MVKESFHGGGVKGLATPPTAEQLQQLLPQGVRSVVTPTGMLAEGQRISAPGNPLDGHIIMSTSDGSIPEDAEIRLGSELGITVRTPHDFCLWVAEGDDNTWHTDCGLCFELDSDGSPEENDFNFCPKCGSTLISERRENEN
jgi:hypothetical protein